MAKGIDISRDIQGLRELQQSMQGLKSEYNAITQAQKYDAQSTELLTAKKESLKKQLEVIAQQTLLYSQAEEQLAQQLEKGSISASDYEREIIKLDQAKQKLHYTSIALQGQLNSLSGVSISTMTSMGSLASETDKSSKAVNKNTTAFREWSKEVKRSKADALMILGVASNLANMFQSVTNLVSDWGAVNEDNSPKLTGMQKAMQLLSIATMAASVASIFFKSSWLGPLGIGVAVAAIAGMIAAANSATKDFSDNLNSATGGLNAYQGMSASVNRTTTQRSEHTVNYNMNINANKYGQDFANNPKVVDALSNAVNRNLGKRIIRT